jgi:hypothetical protein
MPPNAPRFPSVVAAKRAAVAQLGYYRTMMGEGGQQQAVPTKAAAGQVKQTAGPKPTKK